MKTEKDADWALQPKTKEEVLGRFRQIELLEQKICIERIMQTRHALKNLRMPFIYGHTITRDTATGKIVATKPNMPTWLDEAWGICEWSLHEMRNVMNERLEPKE